MFFFWVFADPSERKMFLQRNGQTKKIHKSEALYVYEDVYGFLINFLEGKGKLAITCSLYWFLAEKYACVVFTSRLYWFLQEICVYNIHAYMSNWLLISWRKGRDEIGDITKILWNFPKRHDLQNYSHIQAGYCYWFSQECSVLCMSNWLLILVRRGRGR